MIRPLLTASLLLTIYSMPAIAQGRGFFAGMSTQRKVLAQFDADSNKVLDAAERKAALASLTAQGGSSMRRMFGGSRTVTVTPGPRVAPADVKPVPASVPLFDPGTMRTLFLTFEDEEWVKELIAFNNTDVDVPATVMMDGRTLRDVGVHTRGASSFMAVPEGQKLSLNLSFDFLHKGQELMGVSTLNLLNSHEDPTLLRTVVFQQIAREYLPAPKANFIRVVINGESWGVFTSAEQVNKDFFAANFGSRSGARWKVTGSPDGRGGLEYLGDDPTPYREIYTLKSKEEPKVWADLAHLTKVLNRTPPADLERELSPLLDIDQALRFLALDVALVNNDGFWTRASDYELYQDIKGRFHLIPHDANESFIVGREAGAPGGRGGPPDAAGARGGPPPAGAPPAGAPPAGAGGGRRGAGGGGGGRGGFGFMMSGNASLDPLVGLTDTTKALRSRLLAVPALREKYLSYVRDIATRWLDWGTLGPIVQKHHDLIAPVTRTDTRKLDSTEDFEAGIETFRTFATKRRAFLLDWKAPQ